MRRWLIALAGVSGALAVALGAFGAHGLEGFLAGSADAARRAELWETAVSYHLPHSVALAVCALLSGRRALVAGVAFVVGILLFAGTLYAMTLGAPRVLGAVTPLGGLSLIIGWIALALAGWGKAGTSTT